MSSRASLLLCVMWLAGCGTRTLPVGDGATSVDRGTTKLDGARGEASTREAATRREAGVLCGGAVCGPTQDCCGPAACGTCVPKGSGVYCPPTCPDASVPPPGSCVIAIRVDDCCTQPQPTFAQNLKTDPCLLPYPVQGPVPAGCLAKQPPKCALIDCMWGTPVSRVVVAIPGGSCNWADECQSDLDCVLALNYKVPQCCPCPLGYPKALLAENVCLRQNCPGGASCPPAGCPPQLACGVPCVPCTSELPHCQKAGPGVPGAKNRCLPWNAW